MPEIPLQFPLGGISDALARTRQPELTTPDAVNVRGRDPSTGRLRGGTREGASEVVDPALGSIRQLAVALYDASASTFAASTTTSWEKQTPQLAECRNVAVDAQGNVFALDGRAGVAMFNRDGKLVFKFVLPVRSTEQICRALAVDDSGAFYVGVSEGGFYEDARIWKFRPRTDGSGDPIREWELDAGGFCEDIRIRQGVMYVGLNLSGAQNPQQSGPGQAHIAAYRLIDTGVPGEAWRQEQVPYPLNSMDVRESDGAIFTAHEANATRAYDLRAPDHTAKAEDAIPSDFIDDHYDYLWLDLDGNDIDGDDSENSEYRNGDNVSLWRDKSGGNRSAYQTSTVTDSTTPANAGLPTLDRSKTFGGYDTVAFNTAATDYTSGWQELASLSNGAIDPTNASSQRTLSPTYTDASYSMLFVCRAPVDSQPRTLWHQNDTDAKNYPRSLVFNANGISGGTTATANSGTILLADDPNSTSAAFDATDGFALILITVDNGGNIGLRVNGTAAGSVAGGDETSLLFSLLGAGRASITSTTAQLLGAAPFIGKVARVMCWKKILNATEIEKLEGWAAWKYGIAHLLPGAHTYDVGPPSTGSLTAFGGFSPWHTDYLLSTDPMLVKWDPNGGRPRWVVSNSALGGTSAVATGGLGYGVRIPRNGSDRVFSCGPKDETLGGTTAQQVRREASVRCLRDQGSAAIVGAVAGTWEAVWGTPSNSKVMSYHYPKLGVSGMAANDELDGTGPAYLYVPYHTSDTGAQAAAYVYDYAGDGAAFGGTDTAEYGLLSMSTGARGYGVACGPEIPEYEPGTVSQLPDRYVAVGTIEDTDEDECVGLFTQVSETKSTADPAGVYVLGVAGSSLRRIEDGSATAPTGSVSLPATGYIQATEYLSRLWIAAEGSYFKLDPRVPIVQEWTSKTAGQLYPGCRLVATWADRIVLSGSPEDPFAVFLTGINDPEDCDLFPVLPSGAEAVLISAGDAVTGLIPMRDDLLLVGTQGKLLQLTGNPAAGGTLDRIADVDGLAFGEAWCKDQNGTVYLFHARAGVSRVSSKGVESITDAAIRRRLEAVDLSTYHVRLVWNRRADGLHVIPVPRPGQSGSNPTRAWFWERETGAWWEDSLGFIPTAARAVQKQGSGSSEVWLGCSDGVVRRFDEEASTDDGTTISWRVVGLLRSPSEREQILVRRPRVTLATGLEGAKLGLYGGSESEIPTVETVYAETEDGLGDALPIRARGSNVWWRLSGIGRFAFEGGSTYVEGLGTRRRMP